MPRPLRPIERGLIYHVINRGNNRQRVFAKAADFTAFLAAIADLKERTPFALFGYCLLDNHFHLLLRPGDTSISRIMQSLLVSHTQRYHKHHRSGGHVWQGRFKSPVIQDDEHLLTVLRYIEANPLRAGLADRADEYRWSSFRATARARPTSCSTAWRRMKTWCAVPRRAAPLVGGRASPAARGDTRGGSPLGSDGPSLWRSAVGRAAGEEAGARPDDPPARPPAQASRGHTRKIVLTPF